MGEIEHLDDSDSKGSSPRGTAEVRRPRQPLPANARDLGLCVLTCYGEEKELSNL